MATSKPRNVGHYGAERGADEWDAAEAWNEFDENGGGGATAKFKVGQMIEAYHEGEADWYEGTISAVDVSGAAATYEVTYTDDGEVGKGISEARVRFIE